MWRSNGIGRNIPPDTLDKVEPDEIPRQIYLKAANDNNPGFLIVIILKNLRQKIFKCMKKMCHGNRRE